MAAQVRDQIAAMLGTGMSRPDIIGYRSGEPNRNSPQIDHPVVAV